MRTLTALMLMGMLAACGSERDGAPGADDEGDPSPSATTFNAEHQTPGLYRDTYRLLAAVSGEDHATAVDRLYADVTHKLENSPELDRMLETDRNTIRGLLILALRTMQATEHHPEVAHRMGETIIKMVLALDPARKVWNANHPESPVDVATPGAALIAKATEGALADAVNAPVDSQGNPMPNALTASAAAQCASPTTRSSVWIPGLAELTWTEGYCYPDQYRAGYCEPDRYVEGDCYDVWVEDCAGGRYENRGYYDYVCYTSTDCQYIWRDRYVWVGGNCNNGYWDQQCTGGRYEPGLCYPDEVIPGQCVPGRYYYFYPYGTWTFRSSGSTACDPIVPAQSQVAQTSAKILAGPLSKDISDDSWRAAVKNLSGRGDVPDADYVDAVRQIIDSTKATTN